LEEIDYAAEKEKGKRRSRGGPSENNPFSPWAKVVMLLALVSVVLKLRRLVLGPSKL
jgi:hypothetical protein